jgi:hypothetical protein
MSVYSYFSQKASSSQVLTEDPMLEKQGPPPPGAFFYVNFPICRGAYLFSLSKQSLKSELIFFRLSFVFLQIIVQIKNTYLVT